MDLLKETKDRFILFPLKSEAIWEMYKKQEASIWTAEELDLASDLTDWANKLIAAHGRKLMEWEEEQIAEDEPEEREIPNRVLVRRLEALEQLNDS